jgi:hypothetical protein
MTAYIKISTSEYPRHIGDIEIDPAGMVDYAHVEWVDPPEVDYATQCRFEGPPVLTDNGWQMTWAVRAVTPEDLAYSAEKTSKMSMYIPGSPPNVVG